jgi:hypothetical protein
VGAKKALLIARFLIEPHNGATDVVINEDLEATAKSVVDDLYELIGPYKIYSETETGLDFATEASMKSSVAKRFSRFKSTLQDSLSCEDYDQEGVLDLMQLKEAIVGVEEDIDWHTLDYMLWYVYVRSDSVEKLEYKVLIQMIEEQANAAVQRPQSSSQAKSKPNKR